MSDYSENEDDPCGSSDSKEEEKKKTKRRVSNRKTKKPRLNFDSETSDNDSDSDFKPRTRNGTRKKNTPKKAVIAPDPVAKPEPANLKFASGSFVILKTDIDSYDAEHPPHIWRIDGKALLQKFEPFDEDGELKYRNTSVYTGWSPIESERYAALQDIDVLMSSNQKTILTFDKKQLRELDVDSD